MNTCANCRFWDPEESEHTKGFHDCKRIPMKEKVFEWSGEEVMTWKPKSQYQGITAYVQDASGYRAILTTQADFGCTLFESKEETH